MKGLLILILCFFGVLAEQKTFEGYKVYKIVPKNADEVNFVRDLQTNGVGQLWDDQVNINYEARIMVKPENVVLFNTKIAEVNLNAEVLIGDMQRVIEQQLRPVKRSIGASSSFLSLDWDRYHTLDEINTWMDHVASNYSNVVRSVVMGRSFENREIRGIVINYNPNRSERLIGMLEGTLHAREWISPAVVTWIVKEFLTSNDPAIRSLAENIEWHVFPVVNPDGYVYTFTTNRMWRKNRGTRNFTSCATSGVEDDMSNGVDLNRNFDYVWMYAGASNNPCTNTFAGLGPASEPETQAISNYVRNIAQTGRFIYYYSLHSYTQLVIIPYSHVTGSDVLQAENFGDMYEIAARGASAMQQRFGTVYRYGVSYEILYVMSGTSFDWVKQETNVPVSQLIEMRDLGEHGFLLPADQIIPNSLEIMDGLVEMDRVTRDLGYYTAGSATVVCSVSVILLGIVISFFM